MNKLDILEKILNYQFNDKSKLTKAITHSSLIGEQNYEDFEFLGDSFLSFVVADYLLKNFDYPVGELSKIRAKLVSTDNLCNIIKTNKILEYIRFGKSINVNNLSNKIFADIFESILASIYLDGGENPAKDFVYRFVIIDNANISKISNELVDYKSVLQEKFQKNKDLKIKYQLLNKIGDDNLIVSADTVVVCNDVILGKPKDKNEEKDRKQHISQMLT